MKSLLKKLIPGWVFDLYHLVLAYTGGLIYRFPGRDLTVIGVTGTNGKSTVVELLHAIFSEFGLRVASFSSLRFRIRDEIVPAKLKMTMPGRFVLQRLLARARRAGCQIAVVEVTSEGIKQYRHRAIPFTAAVLTNLQPEHIEAHGSFEAYRSAKGKLFKKMGRERKSLKTKSIVNLDDPSAFYFLYFETGEKFGYGLLQDNVRPGVKAVIPNEVRFSPDGFSFLYEEIEWQSGLVGDFNLYNVLAALTTALSFGLPLERIRDGIRKVTSIPGRLEVIQKEPFRVVVDYAHTPDALEAVYRIVRSLWLAPSGSRGTPGRIIAVLGAAGGGRDHWKRPELGKIAERFADKIYLTNEDPYDEDPQQILEDIGSKMNEKKHETVLERYEAIKKALAEAKKGDAVIITGKGAEQAMVVKDKLVPWDDREAVREALKSIHAK